MSLSRRSFLKSVGLVGAGMALPNPAWFQESAPLPSLDGPITHWDGSPFGRILLNVLTVYAEPSWRAPATGVFYHWNDVVPVSGAVPGYGLYGTNQTWLQTEGGYIYSSWVQPVEDVATNPPQPIPEGGLWGMVTVPWSHSRSGPADDARQRERMYYSTVHRIMALEGDYYRCDEVYGGTYYLKAGHVRLIPPEEITPISPEVPPEAKRIEIRLSEQALRCYEGDAEVFAARVATGVPDTPTPPGEFNVTLKRHGQRMVGGVGDGFYNLPGIPWVCYFTRSYVAIHGTYWHNDYGRRHSNGCVNVLPEAAKWIYRWATPQANYWDFSTSSNPQEGITGTRVIVRW